MRKRRGTLDDSQLAFSFAAPRPATMDGDLAGLRQLIASGVARMLREDPRSRFEVAGRVSALMAEEVTKNMLDAYASEAREQHNVSAERFLALVAATERFDILDAILARVGARVLVGEEMHAARLGHLLAARRDIDQQIRAMGPMTRPIERETSRRRGR